MVPQRYIQLPVIPKEKPFLPIIQGEPYLPVVLGGEQDLSTVFKAVVVFEAIASAISESTFRKLFPSLKDWQQDWSPHVRIKLHFPDTEFGKFNLCTSAKFTVVEDHVLKGNVLYVNPNDVVNSVAEMSKTLDEPKVFRLHYPMTWAYRTGLIDMKEAVLILGNDKGEGLWRMKAIQTEVDCTKLRGVIVRDYLDLHPQSVEEKMNMFAAASLFAIVEHTFPSGAIDELKICVNSRIITCILIEAGYGATWMQSDYEIDYANIKEFIYTMNSQDKNYLPWVVHEAINWAKTRLQTKADFLNAKYPWRREQRLLEESVEEGELNTE